MEFPADPSLNDVRCLRCEGTFRAELRRCDACGFSFDGVKLYKPKHFVWLAVFFSALPPIYMAATNLARMGRKQERWLWLVGGVLGFAVLFGALAVLPEFGLNNLVGYVVNIPIAWYLRDQQRELYREGLGLGAKPASTIVGTFAGLGLLLVAFVLALLPLTGYWTIMFQRGVTALQEDRCQDAQALFSHLRGFDPEDTMALYNLAVAELCLGDFDAAVRQFRDYTQTEAEDPDGHAMLGYCLWLSDRDEEAERSLERAIALDGSVLERLEIREVAFALPGQPKTGTRHEHYCTEELRALVSSPERSRAMSGSLTLGPGLLRAIDEPPDLHGSPLPIFMPEVQGPNELVGRVVSPEQLALSLRSERLREILARLADGEARPATRSERQLFADMSEILILGRPVSVIEQDDDRLLMHVLEEEGRVWVDMISVYQLEQGGSADP